MARIAIIGAGLGGLASAALLAHRGHRVDVYEKNRSAGGKMNEHKAQGYRFDTGPSLLTMPFVLEKLFAKCGEALNEYVRLRPVDPLCRYYFSDGRPFDCFQNIDKRRNALAPFGSKAVHQFEEFLTYAQTLYERTASNFLFNPLYGRRDFARLSYTDIFKIDALSTVAQRVDAMVDEPHLRKLLKRFTTYNGSSPYQAPATLNVIPHVELNLGGYYVEGGMYRLVEALKKLATKNGARFHYHHPVHKIEVSDKTVNGVQIKNQFYPADVVVANSDAWETYMQLLPQQNQTFLRTKKMQQNKPSCSGFVLLLGVEKTFSQLSHHTIFFSKDYRQEFRTIFEEQQLPEDPTIYIANTSHHDEAQAPAGASNLFVLVNAPALSKAVDWNERTHKYGDIVIQELEKRGLAGLSSAIAYRHHITPQDFYSRYRSYKGSIYGTASNSKWAAFVRPKNKFRGIDGLYQVGGSAHPGGGIPLVVLSALHAATLIRRYE